MSTTNVKEFLVPVRPFPHVTVGKKYPIIERDKGLCLIIDDTGMSANWWISEGEFELVKEVDVTFEEPLVKLVASDERAKPKRKMKFSNKPGSAVVTYKSGETFHISRLNSMSVFQNENDVLVDVVRTYAKDGLIFQERVGIPVKKFEKVVWMSPDGEIEIKYDEEEQALFYNVKHLAIEIDFGN